MPLLLRAYIQRLGAASQASDLLARTSFKSELTHSTPPMFCLGGFFFPFPRCDGPSTRAHSPTRSLDPSSPRLASPSLALSLWARPHPRINPPLACPPVFSRYTSPSHSLLLPKLTFIAVQLAAVALGMYKCWSMGLLPTESSDWLAWRSLRTVSLFELRAAFERVESSRVESLPCLVEASHSTSCQLDQQHGATHAVSSSALGL